MTKRMLVMLIVIACAVAMLAAPALAKSKKNTMIRPGSIMIGGDFDLSIVSGDTTIEPDGGDDVDSDQFEFGFSALAGYFFAVRGLEAGGLLEYSSETDKDDVAEEKTSEWAIGPQVGYFYPVAKDFYVFGMLGLGYQKLTTENDPKAKGATTSETEIGGWFFEPRGGAMYALNRHLGVTGALFYRYSSGSGEQDSGGQTADFDIKNKQFGIKVGLLGFF